MSIINSQFPTFNVAAPKGTTFKSIMSNLKARNFAPFYLLMGEEAYYIDRIADYIAENVLTVDERDFNQTVVYGADTTAAQVTDMARRYPMMSEYQVIIVREAQVIKSLDALERYLNTPVKSTILVWCHKNGSIDKRKKVAALAEKAGVVFESAKLKDWQLNGFIEEYLKEQNVSIDQKSTQIIADHIGSDLHRLASELNKLTLSMGEDDRTVTPELVEQKIGVSKDYNPFELKSALINKDVLKANRIVKYFDKNPKAGSLYACLPLIFNYFQNLMIVHYAPNRAGEGDIAAALDMRSQWGAKDYLVGLRNFTARKTMDIIEKIREIDAKSKGLDNPSTPAEELMKELIFFILH